MGASARPRSRSTWQAREGSLGSSEAGILFGVHLHFSTCTDCLWVVQHWRPAATRSPSCQWIGSSASFLAGPATRWGDGFQPICSGQARAKREACSGLSPKDRFVLKCAARCASWCATTRSRSSWAAGQQTGRERGIKHVAKEPQEGTVGGLWLNEALVASISSPTRRTRVITMTTSRRAGCTSGPGTET